MYAVKGSLVDLFGHLSKKGGVKVLPPEKQEIAFEELPLTFKEWERMDNLFMLENSTIFKTFLSNHYRCLFHSDFIDHDWT
jgi:hypothetical protein